jgi:hypothetical protein
VPEAFVHHVRTLAGVGRSQLALAGGRLKLGPDEKPLDPRALTEYPALLEALELENERMLPHAFKDGEPESGHVCLDPCATLAVASLGLDRVLQLAAVPHRVTTEDFLVLRAPVTVYSGEERTIVEANGKLGVEVHRNVINATSLVGAALRLIDREGEPPYQFCPQVGRCPYYENALCHRQFAPPRESRSYEQCGFPMFIKAEVGMDPSELWTAEDRATKSPQQLVEAFDKMGEAGILKLCREERVSLTKWLGADGYHDIEWKCEATGQKVVRALQTRKTDHLIEARAFRNAVVREVRERLLKLA